ncbi:MAG: Zn-dependent hydrolase [Desulfuromonas sp.]|nr:Zn-dependent hydrolase [Desulfuromonas sp.]
MNSQRFQDDFCTIAQFGVLDNGGVTRLAFSKEDQDARNYLIRQMQAAGLTVVVDGFGNIRGRRAGKDNTLPAVMVGSHLDTVPHGGHYDGVVGVLAGLEIIRSLNDAQIVTKHPIEIINFAAEESSRFGIATLGSKGLTGQLSVDEIKNISDSDEITLYQVLSNAGYDVDHCTDAVLTSDQVHAFLELHIEQGPILEANQLDVGLVTAIAAPSRFRLTITGRNDHSGTTPMTMRQDALIPAAEIITAVEQMALESSQSTVATVGVLNVHPNAMNVVPGQVSMGVDIRDTDLQRKQHVVAKFKALIQQVEERRHITINCQTLCDDSPIQLNAELLAKLERVADSQGCSYCVMPSGAGHDAMHLANITPTALVFIPSINGLSHNVQEKTSLDAIMKGANVLYEMVVQLAQGD